MRRRLSAVVLAVVVAGGATAVASLSHRASARPVAAPPSSIYSRLARELEQQLPRLPSPTAGVGKQAAILRSLPPDLRRPQQTQGYSCAVAAGTGAPCPLHPCVEYAQSAVATVASAAAVLSSPATSAPRATTAPPAITARCRNKANAPARLIPIRIG